CCVTPRARKSAFVSHVPASRPTMSSPAWTRGSAATPPTAPRPTMTTSVSFSLVAMLHLDVFGIDGGRCLREHLVVVRAFVVAPEVGAEPLLVRTDARPDTRVANQIPANEVGVASVIRVAEGSLNRVRADHVEKGRAFRKPVRSACFELTQKVVLVLR